MIVILERYRKLRGEQSRIMWRLLNDKFDRLKIPGAMRNELMFMNREDYLAWGREEHVLSRDKLELALKYTQLYQALSSFWGDDAISHQWLFSGNNGYKSLFRGRSPLETILEDGERVIDDVASVLRQP